MLSSAIFEEDYDDYDFDEAQARSYEKTAHDFRAMTRDHKRRCRCCYCAEAARCATLALLVRERAARTWRQWK